MNELIEKLGSAQIEYLNALARKSGEATYRERLKNILFNNCAAIIEELNKAAGQATEVEQLRDDVESLEAALAEADEENKKLRKPAKTKGA